MFLIKMNSAGSIMWKRSFGSFSDDFVRGVDTDALKAVYVVGYTGSYQVPGPSSATDFRTGSRMTTPWDGADGEGGREAFVAKFSPTGQLTWSTLLGTSWNDQADAVSVNEVGGVHIVGRTDYSSNSDATFVVKLSSAGDLLWTQVLGENASQIEGAGISARGNGVAVVVTSGVAVPEVKISSIASSAFSNSSVYTNLLRTLTATNMFTYRDIVPMPIILSNKYMSSVTMIIYPPLCL